MRELVGLKTGRPFVPAQLAADRDAMVLRYLNLGFENAAVDVKPDVSRDGTRADLLFTVREGPQVARRPRDHRRQRANQDGHDRTRAAAARRRSART